MNNSTQYCLNNITRSSYYDRDFSSAYEMPFTTYMEPFSEVYNDSSWRYLITGTDEHGQKLELNVEIIYNPDADFDYFVSESCITDGTFLFVKEATEKCVNKIVSCKTYFSLKEPPKDKSFVHYTVGNIVINMEHGDFGTEERPWLRERVTVMIPIKYEIEENK